LDRVGGRRDEVEEWMAMVQASVHSELLAWCTVLGGACWLLHAADSPIAVKRDGRGSIKTGYCGTKGRGIHRVLLKPDILL
jgi:hypothetical protein